MEGESLGFLVVEALVETHRAMAKWHNWTGEGEGWGSDLECWPKMLGKKTRPRRVSD